MLAKDALVMGLSLCLGLTLSLPTEVSKAPAGNLNCTYDADPSHNVTHDGAYSCDRYCGWYDTTEGGFNHRQFQCPDEDCKRYKVPNGTIVTDVPLGSPSQVNVPDTYAFACCENDTVSCKGDAGLKRVSWASLQASTPSSSSTSEGTTEPASTQSTEEDTTTTASSTTTEPVSSTTENSTTPQSTSTTSEPTQSTTSASTPEPETTSSSSTTTPSTTAESSTSTESSTTSTASEPTTTPSSSTTTETVSSTTTESTSTTSESGTSSSTPPTPTTSQSTEEPTSSTPPPSPHGPVVSCDTKIKLHQMAPNWSQFDFNINGNCAFSFS